MWDARLNEMIPSWSAALPDKIGSHDPEMMCHSTGIDVAPKVTAHLAVPSTGIGELLYGFNLFVDGIMRSRRPHFFASLVPHTETPAPVSAIGLPKQLFTTTVARKSVEILDFSFGNTLFLDDLTRKASTLKVSASRCSLVELSAVIEKFVPPTAVWVSYP